MTQHNGNICAVQHDMILYFGDECPLCRLIMIDKANRMTIVNLQNDIFAIQNPKKITAHKMKEFS